MIVNGEEVRIEEVVVAYLKELSQHLPRENEENN
jgi:hypothetical protein